MQTTTITRITTGHQVVEVNGKQVGDLERADWVTSSNGRIKIETLWFAVPSPATGLGQQQDRISSNIGSAKTAKAAAAFFA